jgi:hypothetical protein
MSLNVGEQNSRYVVVRDVTMRFAFSDKVLFADLRTSHKTGRPRINTDTGEIMLDKDGKELPERKFSHWEGRFVGNAFEAAKGLKNGQAINIINGWAENERTRAANGREYQNVYVTISDFEPCDTDEGEGEDTGVEAEAHAEMDSSFYYQNQSGEKG